ncbi:hypothetical protein BV25DRAFT_1843611, partial [Artomyces pyxidatus]
ATETVSAPAAAQATPSGLLAPPAAPASRLTQTRQANTEGSGAIPRSSVVSVSTTTSGVGGPPATAQAMSNPVSTVSKPPSSGAKQTPRPNSSAQLAASSSSPVIPPQLTPVSSAAPSVPDIEMPDIKQESDETVVRQAAERDHHMNILKQKQDGAEPKTPANDDEHKECAQKRQEMHTAQLAKLNSIRTFHVATVRRLLKVQETVVEEGKVPSLTEALSLLEKHVQELRVRLQAEESGRQAAAEKLHQREEELARISANQSNGTKELNHMRKNLEDGAFARQMGKLKEEQERRAEIEKDMKTERAEVQQLRAKLEEETSRRQKAEDNLREHNFQHDVWETQRKSLNAVLQDEIERRREAEKLRAKLSACLDKERTETLSLREKLHHEGSRRQTVEKLLEEERKAMRKRYVRLRKSVRSHLWCQRCWKRFWTYNVEQVTSGTQSELPGITDIRWPEV